MVQRLDGLLGIPKRRAYMAAVPPTLRMAFAAAWVFLILTGIIVAALMASEEDARRVPILTTLLPTVVAASISFALWGYGLDNREREVYDHLTGSMGQAVITNQVALTENRRVSVVDADTDTVIAQMPMYRLKEAAFERIQDSQLIIQDMKSPVSDVVRLTARFNIAANVGITLASQTNWATASAPIKDMARALSGELETLREQLIVKCSPDYLFPRLGTGSEEEE